MDAVAPEYVAARRVLLDALEALTDHLPSLILVGAQAVYHHTGETDLNVPLMTTDADLAIDTPGLADVPEIGAVLRGAGFVPGPNPGHWVAATDVAVDLMVVPHQAGTRRESARAARLAPHDRLTARIARGLEPALVDHERVNIGALEPTKHLVRGSLSADRRELQLLSRAQNMPLTRGYTVKGREARTSRLSYVPVVFTFGWQGRTRCWRDRPVSGGRLVPHGLGACSPRLPHGFPHGFGGVRGAMASDSVIATGRHEGTFSRSGVSAGGGRAWRDRATRVDQFCEVRPVAGVEGAKQG